MNNDDVWCLSFDGFDFICSRRSEGKVVSFRSKSPDGAVQAAIKHEQQEFERISKERDAVRASIADLFDMLDRMEGVDCND